MPATTVVTGNGDDDSDGSAATLGDGDAAATVCGTVFDGLDVDAGTDPDTGARSLGLSGSGATAGVLTTAVVNVGG